MGEITLVRAGAGVIFALSEAGMLVQRAQGHKTYFFVFVILIFGVMLMAATKAEIRIDSALVGYKTWRQTEVDRARQNLDAFKRAELQSTEQTEVQSEVAENTDKVDDPKAKAELLSQLEYNLEIAQGLTIHDYFALYMKSRSKDEMAQIISKLSPEELSELLVAYRHALDGGKAPAAEASAAPEAEEKPEMNQ